MSARYSRDFAPSEPFVREPRLTDRQYALGLEQSAVQSLRRAIPLVRKPAKWIEPGQGGFCFFLALVIACEIAILVYQIWFRRD